MKQALCIILTILSVTVLCLSGCSDFGFNPIGTWTYCENRLYDADGILIKTTTSDEDKLMSSATITFNKSGTGYIGRKEINEKITYEYDDSSVTISGTLKNGENYTVEYKVRDNGKSLVRTDEYDDLGENGKTVHIVEERIYKR